MKWPGLLALAGAALALSAFGGCTQLASPQGWGGPVAVGDVLLAVPERGKLAYFDLSLDDPRPQWVFPISGQKHLSGKQDVKLGAIYATPVLTSDRVYLAGYDGYIYALERSKGSILWEYKSDGPIVGGLLVEGDTIFAGSSDNYLYALDAATGTRKWRVKTGDRIWSRPALAQGVLYVTSMDGQVYALDPTTGDPRWPSPFKARSGIASPPVVAQGKVLVGSLDSRLYALDAANGDKVWDFPADNWFWTEPLVEGGVVYAGSLDGNVYALDLASGEKIWAFPTGEPVRARPALAQGVLVVVNRKGEVFGLDPKAGTSAWAAPVLLEQDVLADPFVQGDKVYISDTDGALHGIKAADGSLLPINVSL